MASLSGISIAMGLAVVVGLGSTDFFLRAKAPLGTTKYQMWTGWPSTGLGTDVNAENPYLQAHTARNGTIPLGDNEGVLLKTYRDSAGDKLVRNCLYRFTGDVPRSQLWTLTVTDDVGRVLPNPSLRYGITSRQLLRSADGKFDIWLARDVQPGNWISLGDLPEDPYTLNEQVPIEGRNQDQSFLLTLRLYGANLSSEASLSAVTFPTVEKVNCP
tara:strand:- start:1065 stop:1709 length:645 start_codon:yes stop_codon:yes gene_type:complete